MHLRIAVALSLIALSTPAALVARAQAVPKAQAIRWIDARRSTTDRGLRRYRVVKKDFLGFSTEGGSLTAYVDGDEIRKISAVFYGETLRSEDEYYYAEDKGLVYVSRQVFRYAAPLPAPVRVKSRDTNRFYLYEDKIVKWVAGREEVKTDDPRFVFKETEEELGETSDFLLDTVIAAAGQAGPKPLMQGPHVRRACIERPDIHVGDAFDKVSGVLRLTAVPNDDGAWTAPGPEYSLDGGGTLRSTITCTFDVRRRLRSLVVAWTYDGERTPKSKTEVIDFLLGKVHHCLGAKTLVETDDGASVARVDYGTYSELFTFDEVAGGQWRMAYTISAEP